MSLLKKLLGIAAVFFVTGAHATYMPVGVQTNVSMAQVSNWGWTQCYVDSGYNSQSLSSILSGCQGNYLMLADYTTGSSNYAVLSAAARSDVLFNTGVQSGSGSDITHTAKGAEWYFSDSWS